MKLLFALLTLATLCAPSYAQTIKTLGYDTTNGQVAANTGTNVLTFTNSVSFNNGELGIVQNQISGPTLSIDFEEGAVTGTLVLNTNASIDFIGESAATTRTNLGLTLPALTNTSNLAMMRALAGSTNTNEPYNGIIQYADSPTGDTFEMTVSNGIILKIEMQ